MWEKAVRIKENRRPEGRGRASWQGRAEKVESEFFLRSRAHFDHPGSVNDTKRVGFSARKEACLFR